MKTRLKLTKRMIDKLAPAAVRCIAWDAELAGFGLRVECSGRKTFVVRYRAEGGGRNAPQRLMAIGRYGVLTPDAARKKAKDILAAVTKGEDPAGSRAAAREQMTVAELCDLYLEKGVLVPGRGGRVKKASTVKDDCGRIEAHIKPLLGNLRVSSVTSADIERLLVDVASGKTRSNPAVTRRNPVRGGKGVATRTTATLGAIFTFAVRQRMRPDNPVSGVPKYAINRSERFLTSDELERLGAAIREAETVGIAWNPDPAKKIKHAPKPENRRVVISPFAGAALRLLLFTGCRTREILGLEWSHVDLERGFLFLPDSKTGRKPVVLNAPALAILSELPRVSTYVIASDEPDKPRYDLKKPWRLIIRRAGLAGLRIHDLRHTHASFGVANGFGLPIIGKLLGHTQPSTTERYAHLDNDPLRRASKRIGSVIAAALEGNPRPARRAVRVIEGGKS
jgi:integrase